jgi:hypothetical protein
MWWVAEIHSFVISSAFRISLNTWGKSLVLALVCLSANICINHSLGECGELFCCKLGTAFASCWFGLSFLLKLREKEQKAFDTTFWPCFYNSPLSIFGYTHHLTQSTIFFLSSSNFLLPILFWFQSALSSELAVSSRCVILVSCTEVAWSQSHFFNDLTLSRQQLHALISFTDLQRELSSNFITAYLSYFCFLAVQ